MNAFKNISDEINPQNSYEISFDLLSNDTGSLVSLEALKNIPFPIKRVYYIFDTKSGVVRGRHAHTKLSQVLIAVSGSCKVKNFDGKCEEIYTLDNPNKGLYIGQNIWREMFDFSTDCVLVVLADEYYDEDDYIRDYDKFLKNILTQDLKGRIL
jgi:UDP-2-acetamido-3-amino-2,3-dideoxy-glucuronate N-acetyltransferase